MTSRRVYNKTKQEKPC